MGVHLEFLSTEKLIVYKGGRRGLSSICDLYTTDGRYTQVVCNAVLLIPHVLELGMIENQTPGMRIAQMLLMPPEPANANEPLDQQ